MDLIHSNQFKVVCGYTQYSLHGSDVHTVSRESNSNVNKSKYIPGVNTTNYGISSIRYQYATLRNKYLKNDLIKVDEDKRTMSNCQQKNNGKLNQILMKHIVSSYIILPTAVFD